MILEGPVDYGLLSNRGEGTGDLTLLDNRRLGYRVIGADQKRSCWLGEEERLEGGTSTHSRCREWCLHLIQVGTYVGCGV